MARTKTKPGPKPSGAREDFHIALTAVVQEGESISLAEAFKRAAKAYEQQERVRHQQAGEKAGRETQGIIAYAAKIIREQPEIAALLKGEHR